MERNKTLDFCSGAAALLNYHKIMDDLADERGLKRFRARLSRPFLAHGRKKALRAGLGELDRQIAAGLSALSELEASRVASADLPAEQFGKILGDILSYGLEGSDTRVAYALGLAVGKWIYLADALDDWEEDAARGRYNPLLLLYGGRLPTEEERVSLADAMKNELYGAEAAADLMDISQPDVRELIQNILYLGLPARVEAIQAPEKRLAGRRKPKRAKSGADSGEAKKAVEATGSGVEAEVASDIEVKNQKGRATDD